MWRPRRLGWTKCALKVGWQPIISAHMSRSISIPEQLLRRSNRVVRPRDLKDMYAIPTQEVQRLAARGVLLHLAHGYYAVPPSAWIGDRSWVPEIEAVALGIAAADHQVDAVAVVGISAARVLGHVPRALRSAVIAVPVRRRFLTTSAGRVYFWRRSVDLLETQVWRSELVQGRVSTVEQALLDVADRPQQAGVTLSTSEEALRSLSLGADWERVLNLARIQGALPSYRRARWFAEAVVPDAPVLRPARHLVASYGLRPIAPTDRAAFGIRDD